MVSSPVGSIWLHNPMASVKDKLQVERALELAAHRDLCSQHAWMSGGLHFGGEPLHEVPPRDHTNQTDRNASLKAEAGRPSNAGSADLQVYCHETWQHNN